MNIFYFVLLILLSLIPIVVIITALLFVWHLVITRRAPFVPIPKKVLEEVVKALELQPNSVLFDLGCGDGLVLLAAQAGQPKAKFVGIDVSWLPITLARWRIRLGKARNIKLTHGSFFKQDL
ncbi:MAG: putative rRNA methylase family protein, partial [Candidatus Yanofskybacteria bacterium GW2011_GWA1_41_6]